MLRFLMLCFICTIHFQLKSQVYFNDNTPYRGAGEVIELKYQVDSIIQNHPDIKTHLGQWRVDVFRINENCYIVFNGRLDVFRWSGGELEKISKSVYHGFNFSSYNFVYKDVIYSYGGYGFWQWHTNLISFIPEKGEWEIVPVEGQKPKGMTPRNCFVVDGVLHSFDGIVLNQGLRDVPRKIEKTHFTLDLEKLIWEKSSNVSSKLLSEKPAFIFESRNYIYLPSHFIMNKDDLEVKTIHHPIETARIGRNFENKLIHFKGDSILRISSDGRIDVKINLENLYNQLESSPTPVFSVANRKHVYFILLFGIVIFTGLVYRYIRNKRKKNNIKISHLDQLLTLEDQNITVDEIDRIFGLQDIKSDETRRSKRASLINSINEKYKSVYGKELIRRERDEEDRRKFVYLIEK